MDRIEREKYQEKAKTFAYNPDAEKVDYIAEQIIAFRNMRRDLESNEK